MWIPPPWQYNEYLYHVQTKKNGANNWLINQESNWEIYQQWYKWFVRTRDWTPIKIKTSLAFLHTQTDVANINSHTPTDTHTQMVSGGRPAQATVGCCIWIGRMCVCANLNQTMVVNGVIRVIPFVQQGGGTTHTHAHNTLTSHWTIQRAHLDHEHPILVRSENIKASFDLCVCVCVSVRVCVCVCACSI